MFDDFMDDLDKKIEEAKERLYKTQKLAELNELQKQAEAISKPQSKQNDPMEKMLKWAFPFGAILAGLGIIALMIFHSWSVGLSLGALGAVSIGIKLGLTPSIRIPFIDDKKNPPPKEQPPAQGQGEGHWIPIK